MIIITYGMQVYHPYEVDLSYKITINISVRWNLNKTKLTCTHGHGKVNKMPEGQIVHVSESADILSRELLMFLTTVLLL
jgi:hypothetical protein